VSSIRVVLRWLGVWVRFSVDGLVDARIEVFGASVPFPLQFRHQWLGYDGRPGLALRHAVGAPFGRCEAVPCGGLASVVVNIPSGL
jgi:hypothetical protein